MDQRAGRAGGERPEGSGAAGEDDRAGQPVGAGGDRRVELVVAVDADLRPFRGVRARPPRPGRRRRSARRPSSWRSTWLAPAETTRWMRSISGCAASRPSTWRGRSIPEAPETRRAMRCGMARQPAALGLAEPPLLSPSQRELQVVDEPPALHGQQQAAAVEAAQDLAAEVVGSSRPAGRWRRGSTSPGRRPCCAAREPSATRRMTRSPRPASTARPTRALQDLRGPGPAAGGRRAALTLTVALAALHLERRSASPRAPCRAPSSRPRGATTGWPLTGDDDVLLLRGRRRPPASRDRP